MKPILRIVTFWLAVLSLVTLTLFSYFALQAQRDDLELMRFCMEDVAGRVRTTTENLKLVRKFSDAAILAKTRAFARLVATDPSILTNQLRLVETAKELDVDELHVSDEKGVLIACVPESRVGLDMRAHEATRRFLPALTDKSFELALDPVPRCTTVAENNVGGTQLFQFTGVARLDKPGIVQVAQRASRVEQAQKLADVGEIQKSTRIGRRGRVSIRPLKGLPPATKGFKNESGRNGRPLIVLESDCADYRIRVWTPNKNWLLGNEWTLRILLALCGTILIIWLALFRKIRVRFVKDINAIRALFAGTRDGSFLRAFRSPVAVACVVAFAFAIAVCWGVSTRTSRLKAQEVLRAAAQDMRTTFDGSVDLLLFYQGNAICQHYKSPENMSTEAVQEVMKRYGLDELNVVNAEGKVVIGALSDVGYDMGSNPHTAAFNCLLNGEKTYSQPFRGAVENPAIRRKYAGVAFPPPAKGYIEIGFAEERVKDDIDYWFADQATGWHIGESGFYIIAKEETGAIDSCGILNEEGKHLFEKGATLAGIGFDVARAPKDADTFFTAELFGVECLCLTEVRSYHRIVTALPLAEVTGNTKRVVLVTAIVLLLVLALVVAFMARLSDLVTRLKGFIAADQDRQLKDLTLAKTIQTSSLPVVFPNEPDYKIFATMLTAREVGGDFYDFYTLPDGKILFLIADVSGKGIPAALFMMRAKATIRAAIFERPDSISTAVRIANDNLADHNEAEMFVTAWIGVFDRATGEIAYVNAGHNPPLIKRADGSIEWVRERGGLVLAAMGGIPYKSHRCTLEKGDSIFLYTDGVSEAMNTANEQYGETRLAAALKRAGSEFVAEIGKDVAAFTDGAEQSDDITMLAFDRLC